MSDDTVTVTVDRDAFDRVRELLDAKRQHADRYERKEIDMFAYDEGVTAFNDDLADAGERLVTSMTVSAPEVWVLDFSAEGPEPGDYDGHQSVHADKGRALKRLIELYAEHGVEYGALSNDSAHLIVAHSRAENASEAVDLELEDGTEIHVGVHRMPVE